MCTFLERGEHCILATILRHEGSTPRTAGTKMIVRENGKIIGTIGGGLVEAEVIEAATEIFASRQARIKKFDLTGAHVASMDMVCGGNLEILVECVEANPENVALFQMFVSSLNGRERTYLVADLGDGTLPHFSLARCLIHENGERFGDFDPPPSLITRLRGRTDRNRLPVVLEQDNRRYLIEPSFTLGEVYLFGAGHVSQQVASLAARVDFRIVVLDDRSEFANRERFPEAHDIRVVDSFAQSFEGLNIDGDSYLVIVTRGHAHDKTVLEQALRTDARYVGMIGSRKKRDHIFSRLKDEGFTSEDLDRVHAPIGMEILAETPEEIGISIVGELIKARAQ